MYLTSKYPINEEYMLLLCDPIFDDQNAANDKIGITTKLAEQVDKYEAKYSDSYTHDGPPYSIRKAFYMKQ